jgi:hypothetical protein
MAPPSGGDDGNAIRGLWLPGRYLAHSVRVTVVVCLAPDWLT